MENVTNTLCIQVYESKFSLPFHTNLVLQFNQFHQFHWHQFDSLFWWIHDGTIARNFFAASSVFFSATSCLYWALLTIVRWRLTLCIHFDSYGTDGGYVYNNNWKDIRERHKKKNRAKLKCWRDQLESKSVKIITFIGN